MARRRRLPRQLVTELAAGGRRAAAPARGAAITGLAALAWLESVEAAMPPVTRTTVRRRLPAVRTRRVTLYPGSVRAEIRQDGKHNQIVDLRVPEAPEPLVATLLGVAERHGRWRAALATGDLPDDLAAAMLEAGLAPAASGLTAHCSCRSVPGMCVHAGIAGHIVARMLEQQPAALLALRGLDAERLRDLMLRRLPGGSGAGGLSDAAAVDWDALVLAPAATLPPPVGGGDGDAVRPGPFPEPPASSGLEPGDLEDMAADAAARAAELLRRGGDGGLGLDVDADLARRAAAAPAAARAAAAVRLGIEEAELRALAGAWRIGGAAAAAALRRRWYATPQAMRPGAEVMRRHHEDSGVRMNWVTSRRGRTDLVLGRDGLWYRMRREPESDQPVLVGPGAADPRRLFAPARHPGGGPEQLPLL